MKRNSDMGSLAEFFDFDESRFESGLTPEIKEAQPHALLKTLAKNAKSFHFTLLICCE